ncbi:hypothetical protein TBLA_0A06780 [Henningerozyma blattae CBS 6284]|uniref:37S ribosomal protein PET123, mitochondrial n=1 Tax=Henningerozyma blattae (strain ATCC 34711 / CBS 6284 / DSM 70876 / NBRC 10599 / NRRL Y-10934 / UCD 77-7) TaxID=1071380 RepID=I2GWG8_HENB6|nr:hypothetical protein TBLA_0A06780 [Tetrapisispora blattae CBS 6284]CCH58470.1 hypothetical protein TBLA_0A06780 [Tetrapisispora blattae CBS 6284]
MGKGIANHGFKSGLLPKTRPILKGPTLRQKQLVDKFTKITAKKQETQNVGYADGIKEPRGSRRVQPSTEYIDVEKFILKTVPKPKDESSLDSKNPKDVKARTRRTYLENAIRNAETTALYKENLQHEKSLLEEAESIITKEDEPDQSLLTVPTIEGLLNLPLMRKRTDEEKKMLDMKRKYNRETMEFRSKEHRLEKLLQLYHASENFIVTEEQLNKHIDKVFQMDDFKRSSTISIYSHGDKAETNLESSLSDALFGTLGNGRYVGLPIVKDYIQNSTGKKL